MRALFEKRRVEIEHMFEKGDEISQKTKDNIIL